jgi:hypothetical protein
MGFVYVAAGATLPSFGGMACYVKYKTRKGLYYEEYTPNGVLYKLLDREVFITKPGFKDYNIPEYQHSYDFAVDADYLGIDSAARNSGIMLIYESRASSRQHRFDKSKFTHGKLFIDSGGFKLASGTEEFIYPEDLAHFYNLYANYGMGLDLPIGPFATKDMIVKRAEIQRLNTIKILKHLNKDVTLYNVSHGMKDIWRRKYIDHVYRDDLDHWAIGGTYYGNVFDFLTRIFVHVDHVKDTGKCYHVFGVANTYVIPILAWLGKYFDITSDSSSHLQCAKNFFFCELRGRQLKKIRVGRNDCAKANLDNYMQPLSCSCNVCHALGSHEMFFKSPMSNINTSILTMHNSFIFHKYATMWSSLANEVSLAEYKMLAKDIFLKKDVNLYLTSLDYIEAFMNTGIEKATKRFSSFRTSELGFEITKGDPANFSTFNDLPKEDIVYSTKAYELYKTYHKTGKVTLTGTKNLKSVSHGRKVKTGISNTLSKKKY